MVSFGTNPGPIVPPSSTQKPPAPRYDLAPAPVFENVDDIPNPNAYKPPVPHQYRSKFFSYKPTANLILGTPLDIKYTPSLSKYDIYKRKQAKSLGFEYRGPQFFEKQAYEYENEKKDKQRLIEKQNYQYYQNNNNQNTQSAQPRISDVATTNQNYYQVKVVPQFGIIYSSGVKYYVPQLVYYNDNSLSENSVYDDNDVKYYRQ